MALYKQIFKPRRGRWLLAILVLLSLASQCHSPMPPLPAPPAGPVLRIGLLLPTGGELATVGQTVRSGISLAFDEWNNRGGLLGHRLEWVIYDTACNFDRAYQAARQAVTDGIQLFIGPICSEAAIGAALPLEIAALMISPTATHPLVTVDYQGQTRPTVFRISYSYEVQAQATAHFARAELGASRAALLAQPGDDYSTYLAEQFAQQFMAEGGQVVYRVAVSPGAGDFTNILTAIQQSGAELIYLPGTPAVVNQVAAKLQEPEFISSTSSANPVPLLLGSDGWESDKLDLPLTEGSYFPVHYLSTEDRAIVQDWLTRYKAVYSVEPTTLAALSYDAANILAEAIAQAGSFEPAAIAEILEKTEFKVVTGPIRFDRNHNPIKPVSFVQVQNNSLVYITSINPGGAPR